MKRAAAVLAWAPRGLVLGALAVYQQWVGPMLPPACRYWPSCSEYARLAIGRRGLWRGGTAALGRLLRCHPLAPGGVDQPR